MSPVQKILVAVDDSHASKKVVEFASSIVNENDELLLLHVHSDENDLIWSFDKACPNEAILTKSFRTNAKKFLEEHKKYVENQKINCTTICKKGEARVEICKLAQTEKANIVVVGSRGNGALKRILLGSVSNYVVNHCPTPVIVVK